MSTSKALPAEPTPPAAEITTSPKPSVRVVTTSAVPSVAKPVRLPLLDSRDTRFTAETELPPRSISPWALKATSSELPLAFTASVRVKPPFRTSKQISPAASTPVTRVPLLPVVRAAISRFPTLSTILTCPVPPSAANLLAAIPIALAAPPFPIPASPMRTTS